MQELNDSLNETILMTETLLRETLRIKFEQNLFHHHRTLLTSLFMFLSNGIMLWMKLTLSFWYIPHNGQYMSWKYSVSKDIFSANTV